MQVWWEWYWNYKITSIIKELLGTKIAECNEIIYQTLTIDDEYESSNINVVIASQGALRSFSNNINFNYTGCTHDPLSATKLLVDIISTDIVQVYRNNSYIDDDLGIN